MFARPSIGLTHFCTAILLMLALQPCSANSNVLFQGKLTIVASSQWTPTEIVKLRSLFKIGYPALVAYYGQPSHSGNVTVRKVSGARSDVNTAYHREGLRIIAKTLPIMNLSEGVFQYPGVLAHELAHIFHSNFVISFQAPAQKSGQKISALVQDAFEEGMAEAAMIHVEHQLHWPPTKTEVLQVDEGFNKPAFSTPSINQYYPALYPIRLTIAAWAFNNWDSKHPGFIKQLNQRLYQEPLVRQPITYTGSLLPIGEKLTPGFKKYMKGQYIFALTEQPGPFLWVVGDSHKVIVGLYQRLPSGKEQPLAGVPVNLTISTGTQTGTKRFVTGTSGIFSVTLDKYSYYVATVSAMGLHDSFTHQ